MARDGHFELRQEVARRDGWSCAYCGVKLGEVLGPDDDFEPATLDHRVARIHGGDDSLGNLVLACSPCNRRKGTRPPSVMFQ